MYKFPPSFSEEVFEVPNWILLHTLQISPACLMHIDLLWSFGQSWLSKICSGNGKKTPQQVLDNNLFFLCFYFFYFWQADLNTNIEDESRSFYGVSSQYESPENMVITCSTKVCSFGKQVVEKVEVGSRPLCARSSGCCSVTSSVCMLHISKGEIYPMLPTREMDAIDYYF